MIRNLHPFSPQIHSTSFSWWLFSNRDRYAVDDAAEQLRNTQEEVNGYFRVYLEMNRSDLLEQWIVHLFSDESEEHIMRLQPALETITEIGFNGHWATFSGRR